MTLQADPAALDRASGQIAEIRDALAQDHAALRTRVEALLGAGWSGAASEQFAGAWAQWCEGVSGVLAGLGLESAALGRTRAELVGTDQERGFASQRLSQRLGEGVGQRGRRAAR